jgi:SAM-dependent methyltransferase
VVAAWAATVKRMAAGEAREHWEGQAEAWIDLTRSDPDYELFNKPSFLDLVPPPGQLTVDVGCGEGRLTRELLGLGHRVVALDGSATLATTAKATRPTIAVALADAAHLPMMSGAADLVVCFMVLMDIENLDQTVGEIARILAPRGVLCAAILHPIYSSGLFVDGDPNQTFYMGEYARPMRHLLDVELETGSKLVFRIEHRPFERYSRALEAAGLALTHVREPKPSDDNVAISPRLAKFQRVPEFLHFRAERHG